MQLPLAHSPPAAQVWPFAFFRRQVFAPLQ
jgi:hypothetical protein